MATVRLHGDLDRLVPPGPRPVPVPVDVAPSVKDVVESLGVPHTEVGLLVVDRVVVGFDARVRAGAAVDVHPVDLDGSLPLAIRLDPSPPEPVRYLADVHLAALARRLRLLGLDTRLATHDEPDARITEQAAAEGRAVLTRDRGLLRRRVVVHGYLVRSDDPRHQVVEVVRRYRLADRLVPFTRCMACNDVPVAIDVAEVADRLEPGTLRDHHEFRRCPGCGRVYWRGSHHARLVAVVDEVLAAVRGPVTAPGSSLRNGDGNAQGR